MSSELEEFEKQLSSKNVEEIKVENKQQQQVVQVQKNILLSYVSDAAGCGHIRNVFPMTYINSVYAKTGQLLTMVSPIFVWQHDILLRTRAIFFQRQMSPMHLDIIKRYKELQPQFKYKMVWDMDDFVWGRNEEQGGSIDDGVPSYNFGSHGITKEIVDCSIEVMKLMDTVTVSTQFLADYIKTNFGIKDVRVVPNAVPAYFWGNRRRNPIKQKLVKPRVIYTGSPTHYMNPIPPRPVSPQEPEGYPGNPIKKLGDFGNAWLDWVIKSVNENKIDFICLGGLPWFFESIKSKITIVNWVDSFNYHNTVINMRADFGIMPLVPNNFNHGKSDIKAIELYATGIAAIGTVFTNGKPSPYDNNPLTLKDDCTVDDIDRMFDKYCEPVNYNNVIDKQYTKLINEGRYLESKEYVDKFIFPFL